MTERTVTVATTDHGTVTIPEPSWCTGRHPEGYRRCDIAHEGPSIAVTVSTEQGPRTLLDLAMWQDPFPAPDRVHSDEVHMVAQLLDSETYAYDVAGMEALATDLLEAAAKVRRMARRLAVEVRGGIR